MKILLTGASGYVGSEVLLELRAAGHEVIALSRTPSTLGTGAAPQIVHDLRKPLSLPDDDFDLIIHAAGANDVTSLDPASALLLTALTTRHAAEFATRQRRPRLLYVSTLQVYGRDSGDIDENTRCQPVNDYALTHLFAEQWVEQYGRTRGLSWVNARAANIAGMPRTGRMERWTLVPGCFCRSAVREQRIVVRSTGLQQRDFLPVAIVARRLVDIADDFDAYACGAVNVCAGTALAVGDVARMATERFRINSGRDCELRFEPPAGASHDTPPPLLVSSRLFARDAAARIELATANAMMNSCIDQTYQYLERSA